MSDEINWNETGEGQQIWLKYEKHPVVEKIWHSEPQMEFLPENEAWCKDKSNVRIVAISDTHCHPLSEMNLPSGDILIHCGDMVTDGTESEMRKVDKEFGEFAIGRCSK